MKFPRKRTLMLAAICGAWTLAVFLLHYFGLGSLLKTELIVQDFRASHGRKTETDTSLVFIGINKVTYQDVSLELDPDARQSPVLQKLWGTFPWSRDVWAELIERLALAGAKVIVLDLIFAAEGSGDDRLAAMLEKYGDRVVIASNMSDFREAVDTVQEGTAFTLTLPSASVLPVPATGSVAFDQRVGYANIWPDGDGVFRRARYRISHERLTGFPGDQFHESLAARALRKMGRADAIPPGETDHRIRFTASPGNGFPARALNTIFLPKVWAGTYQRGEFFRDKVVFVGPAANVFHDEHPTPFDSAQMLGPEIHLNIVNAALHGEFLRETSRAADLGFIAAAGLIVLWLCFQIAQPVKRLAVVVVISLGYWLVADLLFNHANLVVIAVSPLLVLNLSGVSALVYDFIVERIERNRVRRTLERYVSKNIVKELLDNPQTYLNTLGGVRRPVTVLFSDVRNFTTMTEGADEAQLVLQLNEYFTEMVHLVFENHGTLDKFIGDAVMAVWGNILTRGTAIDAQDAVATALAMKRSLVKLNEGWKTRGWPSLAFGIGVNHGEVIVGNLGSVEKMELSVIGDAINLGSRLEGLTKEFHLDLLIGETVAPLVRERFLLRAVHLVQVKGKTKPVEVFEVLGERGTPEGREEPWLAAYENGLRLYRGRQFAEAASAFDESLRLQPDDYITSLYQKRCRDLMEHPPGENWNGVFVMKSK